MKRGCKDPYKKGRNQYQRDFRKSQLEKGLCGLCSKKAVPNRSLCQRHSAVRNKQSRLRQKALREKGICLRCGHNPSAKTLYCLPCRLILSVFRLPDEAQAAATEAIAMFDYKCQCCGETQDKWHFDHCHKTNKFRGILCGRCNVVLGLIEDNRDIAFQLAAYLYRTKQTFRRSAVCENKRNIIDSGKHPVVAVIGKQTFRT